jgi:hypothetical protein
MSKPLNYRTDPCYRALLAEVADLEWQCVEAEFKAVCSAKGVALPSLDGCEQDHNRDR